jgi:hypothetical protein
MKPRILTLLALAALAAPVAHAADGERLLGAEGEVYSVQRGLYKALFPSPPPGWGNRFVLALDIVRGDKTYRVLVPGTDDTDKEQSPALALERTTNDGYVVWAGDHVLNVIGFSEEGWGDVLELSGDPSSTKHNPQLTTTVDRYERLGPDGELLPASRTILHLVWFDRGAAGDRVLYTPLVIEDGNVLRSNRIFDLAELVASPSGGGETNALTERPQLRGGDGGVAVGFVPPGARDLVTFELRSIGGELAFLADKARAIVIDYGNSNPGLTRHALAEKARAVVIDYGRRLLKAPVAEMLAKTFGDSIAAADEGLPLEEVVDGARAQLIQEGVALRLGTASQGSPQLLEIARGDAIGSTTHLLDVRPAVRRALPELPTAEEPRIVLAPDGSEASIAWTAGGELRYRETGGEGWSEEQSLTLGPALSSEQALALLQQRLAGH